MLKIYKETKVNARPKSLAAIVSVSLPSPQSPGGHIEISADAPVIHKRSLQDEDSFATEFLATQGSVYFRKRHNYPRCISWRVIAASRILELHAVDLTKSICESQEAVVLLRFKFHDSIIPHGVALADRDDHDALTVFVLTSSNQLYTLDLRSEFFQDGNRVDENIATWCNTYRPATLSFTAAHRLYASTPLEIFVSLQNGAFLRLTRKTGEDGSNWSLMTFDERSWGASLRGLVKWSNSDSIHFNGKSLDPNTPNAVAITPDQAFAFIVNLNHSLKVWNLASCRLVASKDLIDRTAQQQDALPITLNPADSAFIRIFNAERAFLGGMYYVITYSPHDDGQFKFWVVKGGLTGQLEIEDLFPNTKLKAVDPEPSRSLFWNVIDFQIAPADEGKNMALWVLWGSNTLYQLHSLRFDLSDLPNAWQNKWTKMALELHVDLPQTLLQPGLTDPSEAWLGFIFSPGRYPVAVLETALAVFTHSTKSSGTNASSNERNIQERICRVIQDSVILRKFADTVIDFTRYYKDLDSTWRQFWHVIERINKRRFESLSLALDRHFDIPWIVFADGFSLVRECSGTEILLHNEASSLNTKLQLVERDWPHRNLDLEIGDHPSESATLISLAAAFRRRMTPELIQTCDTALNTEVLVETSLSAAEQLIAFHQRCGFADLLADEMYDAAVASIDHSIGFDKLCTDLFFSVIDTVPSGFSGTDSELLSTEFGLAVTMVGTTENIVLTKQIARDLLLLVVFIEMEVDCDNFNGPELFSALVSLLREYEILAWLGSKPRALQHHETASNPESRSDATLWKNHASTLCKREVSILEDLFAVHIKPRPCVGVSQMYVLMQQVCDVVSWTTRQGEVSLEDVLVFIQCDLIASSNIDLAADFLRFQPDTGWSTYVKGRLYLARRDFDEAAVNFQKASYTLSYGKPTGNLQDMSSKLVDMTSTNSFYNGLSRYFLHIMDLFEQARSFLYVAYFGNLSLQTAPHSGTKDSEQNDKFRIDLVPHLFNAQLKMYHFDEAYTTLSNHPDPSFRGSALDILFATIFATYGSSAMALAKFQQLPLSLDLGIGCSLDGPLASFAAEQKDSAMLKDRHVSAAKPAGYLMLKALHVARNNLEGAANASYQRLCSLRHAGNDAGADNLEKQNHGPETNDKAFGGVELLGELLTLINLLASMGSTEPYIIVDQSPLASDVHNDGDRGAELADGISSSVSVIPNSIIRFPRAPADPNVLRSFSARDLPEATTPGTMKGELKLELVPNDTSDGLYSKQSASSRCVVITLEDLRREYQLELDRVCRIQNGDWEYGEVGI